MTLARKILNLSASWLSFSPLFPAVEEQVIARINLRRRVCRNGPGGPGGVILCGVFADSGVMHMCRSYNYYRQCNVILERDRQCVMATAIRSSWVQRPRPFVLLADVPAPARLAWLSALVIPICITHSIPIDHEHLLSHDAVNYGRPLSICLAD